MTCVTAQDSYQSCVCQSEDRCRTGYSCDPEHQAKIGPERLIYPSVRPANWCRMSGESPVRRGVSSPSSRAPERGRVFPAVKRIRPAAKRNPKQKLVSLLHPITVDALHAAYLNLKRKAASGVDGGLYADGLKDRLADLHDRVHSGAYRALPSRRVYIPKAEGANDRSVSRPWRTGWSSRRGRT